MRPVGIVTSTLQEATTLLQIMAPKEDLVIHGKQFHKGVIKRRYTCLCICGVGKANAAHGTALLLEKFHPETVYIIGVAGGYPSSGLNIGDIAVADKEIYGDEGLLLQSGLLPMDAIGLPLAAVGNMQYYNEFPLHVPDQLADYRHKGAFVTVSSCTGTVHRGMEIEKSFNALCESMEGAAVAHVCLMHGTPVAEIRGISNTIEDRTGKPLDKTAIREAAEKVQQFLIDRIL